MKGNRIIRNKVQTEVSELPYLCHQRLKPNHQEDPDCRLKGINRFMPAELWIRRGMKESWLKRFLEYQEAGESVVLQLIFLPPIAPASFNLKPKAHSHWQKFA